MNAYQFLVVELSLLQPSYFCNSYTKPYAWSYIIPFLPQSCCLFVSLTLSCFCLHHLFKCRSHCLSHLDSYSLSMLVFVTHACTPVTPNDGISLPAYTDLFVVPLFLQTKCLRPMWIFIIAMIKCIFINMNRTSVSWCSYLRLFCF